MAKVKTFESRELGVTIKVNYDLCNGAAECVSGCPQDVYELVDGKAAATSIDQCVECCLCVEVCPQKAIRHSSC